MKNYILLFGFLLLMLASCKKDDPAPVTYDSITRGFIVKQEANLKDIDISIGKNGVSDLKAGAIILFKSHLGNYGKLEVLSVDASDIKYPITYNLTVFQADGQVKASVTNQVMQSTYGLDLESGTAISGFDYLIHNSNNGVDFYLFSMGEVRLYLFKN